MKIKTGELSGEQLNWAVAVAVGLKPFVQGAHYGAPDRVFVEAENAGSLSGIRYKPSTDWSQGGPLIERFGIRLGKVGRHWYGGRLIPQSGLSDNYEDFDGETDVEGEGGPLIAACRAIVAAKLGDEVDVPEGLV